MPSDLIRRVEIGFPKNDMRQQKDLERFPIPLNREVL
jgi:hypothetical protein